MQRRRRILIAAQAAAVVTLEGLLLDLETDAVRVHTTAHALRALDQSGIDAILCSILFDDSRMMEFLQTVKASPATTAIPFVCARVLRGALSDHMVEQLRMACRECGAADFLDLATMSPRESAAASSAALRTQT